MAPFLVSHGGVSPHCKCFSMRMGDTPTKPDQHASPRENVSRTGPCITRVTHTEKPKTPPAVPARCMRLPRILGCALAFGCSFHKHTLLSLPRVMCLIQQYVVMSSSVFDTSIISSSSRILTSRLKPKEKHYRKRFVYFLSSRMTRDISGSVQIDD